MNTRLRIQIMNKRQEKQQMFARRRKQNEILAISLEPKAMKPAILSKSKLMNLILKEEQNKTEFKTTELEDTLVELFTQVKEIPENQEREIDKLGGNIERFGVVLGNFRNNTMNMYEKQKQLLRNYAHNVNGEIYKADFCGENGEHGQTFYVVVPADAPIVKDSVQNFIDCFSAFINNYDEIMVRYSLRYIIKNKLPDRSTEKAYNENTNETYSEEIQHSFVLVFFSIVGIFVYNFMFGM